MPRPRLTPEELEARIAEYCGRYGVKANDLGLPPFPAGQRETQQHRDWVAVYKAHDRLARRKRGQCERCEAPASDGAVFCEAHRAGGAEAAGVSSPSERKAILLAQAGRCPICTRKVGVTDVLDSRRGPAFLHPRCSRLVATAAGLGPEGLQRLLAYLGPPAPATRRR